MMHHMNSEEISSFWEFERRRYQTQQMPLVFAEVYQEFIAPQIRDMREDWDNASDEFFLLDFDMPWEDWRKDRAVTEEMKSEADKVGHTSWEACREACMQRDNCYQWYWHDEVCCMQTNFRLGRPMKKEEEPVRRSISGWNVDKINRWIEEAGQCGSRVEWPDVVKYAINQAMSLGGDADAESQPGEVVDATQGVVVGQDPEAVVVGDVMQANNDAEFLIGDIVEEAQDHPPPFRVSQGKSYGDSVGSAAGD